MGQGKDFPLVAYRIAHILLIKGDLARRMEAWSKMTAAETYAQCIDAVNAQIARRRGSQPPIDRD